MVYGIVLLIYLHHGTVGKNGGVLELEEARAGLKLFVHLPQYHQPCRVPVHRGAVHLSAIEGKAPCVLQPLVAKPQYFNIAIERHEPGVGGRLRGFVVHAPKLKYPIHFALGFSQVRQFSLLRLQLRF